MAKNVSSKRDLAYTGHLAMNTNESQFGPESRAAEAKLFGFDPRQRLCKLGAHTSQRLSPSATKVSTASIKNFVILTKRDVSLT